LETSRNENRIKQDTATGYNMQTERREKFSKDSEEKILTVRGNEA